MSQELYYTAPSDEIFEEVKKVAIELWSEYDDKYSYATGKIDRIKEVKNFKDNFMYIVAMFDSENQEKLKSNISTKALTAINERLN